MPKNINLLLKGSRVVDPVNGIDAVLDIGVADGKVVALDAFIAPDEAEEVHDIKGYIAVPGIIDTHVHASAIIGGAHAHQMMAKAGVTTALEMAGPVESVWEIMLANGAGLNVACIHAVAPGFSVKSNAPSADELQNLFETVSAKGAIGFKVVGGHFPLTPASTLLCMHVAEKNRGYFAIHAGTTETGSNLKGFMEAVELAKEHQIHIAHINSYCRGMTDRAIHEAIAAADTLEANPNLFSESYLSPINGTTGLIADDRPASNATALTLERFDLPPTYEGMKRALLKGIAGVMVSQGGEMVIQKGAEAVRRWEAASTKMNVSFDVNPPASRFHLAVAKRKNGFFSVDALSTDGGGIPRNVLVENGLALVDFQALTLKEFVLKTSTNPAWMLGLQNKGTLGVGADADITVLDRERNRAIMSVADGKVIMFKGYVVGDRGTALVLPQGKEYVTALGLKAKLVGDQAFFQRPPLAKHDVMVK